MSLLGIDFSTHAVDCVLLPWSGERAHHYRFPLTGDTAFDRARAVRPILIGPLAGVDMVAIESPKSNRFGTAVALARVQGAILQTFPPELTVLEVAPAEWRLECGLPGNASKAKVAAWVGGVWADAPADQNALDAFAIAYAARQMNRRANEAA